MLSYFFLRSVATSLNSLKRRKHVLVWHEPETPWHLQTTAILSRTAWNRRKKDGQDNNCIAEHLELIIAALIIELLLFHPELTGMKFCSTEITRHAVLCCITVYCATHDVLISSFREFGWNKCDSSHEIYREESTLPLLLLCCKCNHSNERYWAAPSRGAFCYDAQKWF